MNAKRFVYLLFLIVILPACSAAGPQPAQATTAAPLPSLSATRTVTQTAPPTKTPLPSATVSPTSTVTSTPTQTPTLTETPSPTPTLTETPTSVPTYGKIRGKVTIDQAVCHYGPGGPYLYKFGVYKGNTLEILRKVAVNDGYYVEIQAIGGNNRCWVNGNYFEFKGDLASVKTVRAQDVPLPMSPYYSNTVSGVSASRSGSEVTIAWDAFILNAGDDSEQYPYLVEAWVCQGGRNVFHPAGSNTTSLTITDEPGCAEPSHARIYAVEKHGYTTPVEIPWP